MSNVWIFVFPDESDWKPHFFVLTRNKIFYSEVRSEDADADDDGSTAAGGGSGAGGATGQSPALCGGQLNRLQSVVGDQVGS
jgi:hypothetical protein